MKKFAASLLALILCLGLCAAAISEETATVQLDKNNMSGTSQVRLTVSIVDDFTVIIPASVTIDPETKTGTGTITLKAGYVLGGDFKKLYVRLAGAENGIESGMSKANDASSAEVLTNFTLKSEDGKTCKYSVKASNAPYAFSKVGSSSYGGTYGGSVTWNYATDYHDFNLISATSTENNSADKTCTLTYTMPTLPIAGTYTDTLTFSIVTVE